VNLCRFFVYICVVIGDPVNRGESWHPITQFYTVTFVCLYNLGTGFPTRYVIVLLCSIVLVKSWMLVLLILVELLTITVYNICS